MKITKGLPFPVPQQQPDSYLNQANPVSATLYPVLPVTSNVRLQILAGRITWAVTQPTPLELVVTIDGQTIIFSLPNPVTNTAYEAWVSPLETVGDLRILDTSRSQPFILEGRSVQVQARITWAVTQPTPLECRVKWARW